MVDKPHSQVVVGSRHAIHNLTYPDTANREAGTNEGKSIVVDTDNLYQIAKQDDDQSLWMLTAIGPPLVWIPVSGAEGLSATSPSIVDAFSKFDSVDADNLVTAYIRETRDETGPEYNTILELGDSYDQSTWAKLARLRTDVGEGVTHLLFIGDITKDLVLQKINPHEITITDGVTTHNLINSGSSSGWEIKNEGVLSTQGPDTTKVVSFKSAGLNGETTRLFVSDRTPVGNITGNPGDLCCRVDGVNSELLQHSGASANNTDWGSLGGDGYVVGPASALNRSIAIYDGTTGELLQGSNTAVSATGMISMPQFNQNHGLGDTVFCGKFEHTGGNNAIADLFVGDRNPGGIISAGYGALYIRCDGVNSALYMHKGAAYGTTGWTDLSGGSGDVSGPASSTDNAIARFDSTTGKLLLNSLCTIGDTGILVAPRIAQSHALSDLNQVMSVESTGSNGNKTQIFSGDRNPLGNVTGTEGDLYVRGDGADSSLYQHRDASENNTGWKEFGPKMMVVEDEKTAGTNGGTSSNTTYHDRDLNQVRVNTIDGASLSSNQITLPPGQYHITARAEGNRSNAHFIEWTNTSNTVLINGLNAFSSSSYYSISHATLSGYLDVSSTTAYKLRHYIVSGYSTSGLGVAMNVSGRAEIYANVTITKIG